MIMKSKMMKTMVIAAATFLLFTGCKKEGEHNHGEVITSVVLHFTPAGGGSMQMFEYSDPDGNGGNPPVAQNITLQANKTYNVDIEFWDKSKNPAVNITNEVKEESTAHRIYYQPSAGSNVTIGNLNNDANGIPLGTSSTWTTGAAANGTVTITLRHYGGNPANKAANDPVDSPKSSTDAVATFNVITQN
jgi:hypothetical protein